MIDARNMNLKELKDLYFRKKIWYNSRRRDLLAGKE